MEHSTYIDSLPESSIGRYNEKLSLVGLEKCPYEMIEDVWSIDPSQWPQMQYHDLLSDKVTWYVKGVIVRVL
jgi:hypothetical protein